MTPLQRKAKSVEMKTSIDHPGAVGGFGRRLRRPHLLIPVAIAAAVAAVAVSGAAARQPALSAPKGLQTFSLKVGDSVRASADAPTYSRTPSFAWAPVRGATRYEFELSTSNRFRADNGVVWSSKTLTTPAASVPISLPWITGPSLYWHVRALDGGRVSPWSASGPFEMGWTDGVPQQLASEPGYVKWTPIAGATGYDVWFGNLGGDTRDGHSLSVGKIFSTVTTVADEREYTTLRAPGSAVLWRVRARRQLYGSTKNGLPRVSYGPWSRFYAAPAGETAVTTPLATPLRTVSSYATSAAGAVQAHPLMPVFVWSRDGYQFHRVVVATDRDCVNVVHVGSIVGGTAYAPRSNGPLALKTEDWDPTHSFLLNGEEGSTLRSDGEQAATNELPKKKDAASSSTTKNNGPAPVDLWDSNWPTGKYYWTVVPVTRHAKVDPAAPKTGSEGSENAKPEWEYQDVMLPQDACQAGSVLQFGKKSANQRLSVGPTAYVTGLSPNGRLRSAPGPKSSFYGVPLVAWTPAAGAIGYDVQWSHARYPWRVVGSGRTYSTSAILPLRPGTWWYRVRGINPWLPGNKQMSWSNSVRIHIAKPTFSVAGG
jgi:hypothetical protein